MVKQAVSLRLDADVIAWLKKLALSEVERGYQTRANRILRQRMLAETSMTRRKKNASRRDA
jgi:uncharacterized protein (DUF4415 family)